MTMQTAQDRIDGVESQNALNVKSQISPKTILDLSYCDLTIEELEKIMQEHAKLFSTLTKLSLAGNKFTILPKGIESLMNLKLLDLSDNNFITFSETTIKNLINHLTILHLLYNPLDRETLGFFRNITNKNPNICINANISLYESMAHWKVIFGDMPKYKNNASFIQIIASDSDLQHFISKAHASLLYRTHKQEMIIGLESIFEALLDPNSKAQYMAIIKIDAIGYSTSAASIHTIRRYLEQCTQQNKEPSTDLSELNAMYNFIKQNAETFNLRHNKTLEQIHGLLNAPFLENNETYHNNNIFSEGIVKNRLPSITNYPVYACGQVWQDSEEAFAKSLCKTNKEGDFEQNGEGHYIPDENKYKEAIIAGQFVSFVDGAIEQLYCILRKYDYSAVHNAKLGLFTDENGESNNERINLIQNAQLHPGQTLEEIKGNLKNYFAKLEKELQPRPKINYVERTTLAETSNLCTSWVRD